MKKFKIVSLVVAVALAAGGFATTQAMAGETSAAGDPLPGTDAPPPPGPWLVNFCVRAKSNFDCNNSVLDTSLIFSAVVSDPDSLTSIWTQFSEGHLPPEQQTDHKFPIGRLVRKADTVVNPEWNWHLEDTKMTDTPEGSCDALPRAAQSGELKDGDVFCAANAEPYGIRTFQAAPRVEVTFCVEKRGAPCQQPHDPKKLIKSVLGDKDSIDLIRKQLAEKDVPADEMTARGHPVFVVVRTPDSSNPGWNFHLEGAHMTGDNAEVCDDVPINIQNGRYTARVYCPWGARPIEMRDLD